MVTAGCEVKILMADWFLQRHPKIGSNLNKIRTIGSYNIAMWKAAGMYIDKVDIKWLSDELNHRALDYWPLAMNVSRKYTMKRMARYLLFTDSGHYFNWQFLFISLSEDFSLLCNAHLFAIVLLQLFFLYGPLWARKAACF